jgi:hypothetical protein
MLQVREVVNAPIVRRLATIVTINCSINKDGVNVLKPLLISHFTTTTATTDARRTPHNDRPQCDPINDPGVVVFRKVSKKRNRLLCEGDILLRMLSIELWLI